MTPLETLIAVFGILIVGGTTYELYNETKSHHKSTRHHRDKNYRLSRTRSKSRTTSSSGNDFFGLFKKSRKDKHKKSSHRKSQKISPRTSRKLYNIFKNTLEKKKTSQKLRSEKRRKHTSSMNSSEKRQYYLNKFKHNVHKTKKRRRRVYI
jgi:hypothetical protein